MTIVPRYKAEDKKRLSELVGAKGAPTRPSKVYLKLSSSVCALLGGSLVASHTAFSGYGFLLLALSSSQLLVASILDQDGLLIFYSGSVLIFVDCLGVYRWLL